MDNVFLIDDELENTNQDYINENDIIYRQPDLAECEDNKSGIYDIHKLIYKEISRENILLSSEDLKQEDGDKGADSKTLKFDLSLNKSGGVSWKKNVIGFRLNECIYTSPVSNITGYNNKIQFYSHATNSTNTIHVPVGYYNIHSLMNEINSQFGAVFNLTFNHNTNTVSINSNNKIQFQSGNKLLIGLGFGEDQVSTGKPSYKNYHYPIKADSHPALHIGTYVDIVVDEVPYGACKQNPKGLNIIHRLPVATSTGSSIVYYKSNFIDHNYQHLFPPMNLSHLTIHLYMDGQELPLENLTISFEFELVILNK